MKINRTLLVTLAVVLSALAGWRMVDAQDAPALRYAPNEAFGFGEVLNYDVSYGFITAGTATMAIDPGMQFAGGHKCYHMMFDVQSLKSFDWLYRVHDHYDTYIDIDGIYPLRFEQHIREGGYSRDFSADFDQRAHTVTTSEGQTFQTDEFVHDILSAYYFVRTVDLKNMHKDDVIHLHNFYKDKTYDLDVRVLGRQVIEVDAGKFRCVVIEPLVKEGGLFKSEGRIVIWLTDDERKIPVKVSTKVVIGSIDAVLTSYSGTRGPVDAKLD